MNWDVPVSQSIKFLEVKFMKSVFLCRKNPKPTDSIHQLFIVSTDSSVISFRIHLKQKGQSEVFLEANPVCFHQNMSCRRQIPENTRQPLHNEASKQTDGTPALWFTIIHLKKSLEFAFILTVLKLNIWWVGITESWWMHKTDEWKGDLEFWSIPVG